VTAFVLATANRDKAAEIEAILGPGVELVPRPDSVGEVDETGETLEANARLKAQALVDATGLPAIADDTGLEVHALDGRPGVYSARFAGPDATYADNVARLLQEMAGVADRRARFHTVALALWPDGHEVVAVGSVEGRIAAEARGGNGFGYDPVFEPVGTSRTFAEMSAEEKNAVSHRGRAFEALAQKLRTV
jgi:XTP/dITP diphosphohydrolase